MCQIDINGVKITLTEEQLAQIKAQTDDKITIDNLDYAKACKVLDVQQRSEKDYWELIDWYEHKLKTIIKAANYLDNNNCLWKPDWLNPTTYKYYNWFEKKLSGWVFRHVYYLSSFSFGSVGFYFKKESTAKIVAKNHLYLYSQILG